MSDDAIAPPTKGGSLTELRLAVSFLTIIPVIDQRRASEDAVTASFAWFPVVGCLIGIALAAEDWLLSYVFAQVIRSVLIIISLTVVTGAVHLDGLADTADALGAGRNRERALDILRDSRVGTFGASAIFFDLTLKILALSTLAGTSPLCRAAFRAHAGALGDGNGRLRPPLSARPRLGIDAPRRKEVR